MKRLSTAIFRVLVVAVVCILVNRAWASSMLVVNYKSPDNSNDTRSLYEAALVRLALEKTEAEYGPYHMKLSPRMGVARQLKSLSDNVYTNLVLAFPYQIPDSSNEYLDYARFPIELGILGVRTCFVSEQSKAPFSSITKKEQLKLFVHGQGRSWGDVDILRHNGLQVTEVEKYENLFRMIAVSRFDLFCRGANEIFSEYETYKDVKGIFYDRSIAVRYNFPRFLYFNKKNKELGSRLTKGLLMAYQDGSLHKLWREDHKESIDFVDISKRKIFDLENPFLDSIDFDYEQYFVEWARAGTTNEQPGESVSGKNSSQAP